MNLKLKKIQHVGIPVTNLVRSEAFYTRLGFKNVMSSAFTHNGAQGKVVMMKQSSIMIEIYQLPDAELNGIRNRQDGRIDHIAFDVVEIDIVYDTLKNEGFKIFESAPVFLPFWKKGCKYFNMEGPDGERLEFCEILK